MKKKRLMGVAGVAAAAALALAVAGCGGTSTSGSAAGSGSGSSDYKVSMVTDTGSVNDRSFNQSAWEGLQQLEKDSGISVSYTESKKESDFAANLDKAVDDGNNLVWGVGFAMAESTEAAAKQNPDVNFAVVDNSFEKPEDNLTGLVFRAQEPSFVVGYIAAMTTQTGKVGFVGGQQSAVIDQFEYGFKAGVEYANKTQGKSVTVDSQYVGTFTDSAKGKGIAQKMYGDGCDIVFHAAGGSGMGVIEAAKDADKLVIGVDKDQYDDAPDNMLTSAMKNVDKAVEEISQQAADGEKIGGQNIELGMSDGAVGISEHHDLMSDDVYQQALDLEDQIKDGKITPPATEDDYNTFVSSL